MAGRVQKILDAYRISADEKLRLDDIDPRDRAWFETGDKDSSLIYLDQEVTALAELQRVLYGEHQRSVLVILQGLDTSGKDGTIRKVFGPINPQGVRVASFMKPTEREMAYDYLWRVHDRVPPHGFIGVFNRSHYEDVLVPGVTGSLPAKKVEQRIRQIRDFERYLAENDVTIIKLFLHISRREQKERLEARLADPTKKWKFDLSDLAARELWSDYRAFYESLLPATSRKHAPWYVIPADRKWVRNAVVARLLRGTLEDLDLQYPPPAEDLDEITIPD